MKFIPIDDIENTIYRRANIIVFFIMHIVLFIPLLLINEIFKEFPKAVKNVFCKLCFEIGVSADSMVRMWKVK